MRPESTEKLGSVGIDGMPGIGGNGEGSDRFSPGIPIRPKSTLNDGRDGIEGRPGIGGNGLGRS